MRAGRELVSRCSSTRPDVACANTSALVAKYVRGMYAIRVVGRVPEDVEEELAGRGMTYRPRDGHADDLFHASQ